MIRQYSNEQDVYTVNSNAKLFDARLNKGNNSYNVTVTFPSQSYYMNRATAIIDSGASNTIITVKALYGLLSPMQKQIIENAAIHTGAFKKSFSSANGTNDLHGTFCMLPEITIENHKFKNFPFYLLDNDKTLILLGYDFISSCDVVQIKNKPIAFYNYDRQDMISKFPANARALNLLNVSF